MYVLLLLLACVMSCLLINEYLILICTLVVSLTYISYVYKCLNMLAEFRNFLIAAKISWTHFQSVLYMNNMINDMSQRQATE